MSKFRAHAKHVEKEAKVAHMIESSRIRDIQLQNQALQLQNAKSERRNSALTSLPAVNYLSKQSRLSNLKHPGTCEWLQKNPKFQSWYAQLNSDCLCCYGIPGSGKSVLAASLRDFLVHNALNDNNQLVCHYYCDYADLRSLDSTCVLASIIKQAFEHLPLDILRTTSVALLEVVSLLPPFLKA